MKPKGFFNVEGISPSLFLFLSLSLSLFLSLYIQRREHDEDDGGQYGVGVTGAEQSVGVEHPGHQVLHGPHNRPSVRQPRNKSKKEKLCLSVGRLIKSHQTFSPQTFRFLRKKK